MCIRDRNADRLTRKEVVDKALAEAKKYGGVNQNGNVYVHVNDTDADVIISAKVLRHGLDRRFTVNAPATLKVGEILQNAVRINELVPKLDTIDATYVPVSYTHLGRTELAFQLEQLC